MNYGKNFINVKRERVCNQMANERCYKKVLKKIKFCNFFCNIFERVKKKKICSEMKKNKAKTCSVDMGLVVVESDFLCK